MNFQELGLALKREREKKGLSIEVVMEATKISRSNIEAMENGDRSGLPHPVYAKGFVKSYARYLGLDADELSMVVDAEFQGDMDEPEGYGYDVSPAAEKAFQEKESPELKKKSGLLWLAVVALLAVGVVFFFMTLNGDEDAPIVEAPSEQIQVEPTPEVVPAPLADALPETESDVAQEEPLAESVETTVDDPTATEDAAVQETEEQAAETETAPQEQAAAPEPEVQAQPAPEPAVEDPAQKYRHVLIIRATTEKGCWIGVWRGDETEMARDFVLKEGEPLRLMFNSPRRVRIGNVAGVTVTYNGEPFELDGSQGNIQTLRFGMD